MGNKRKRLSRSFRKTKARKLTASTALLIENNIDHGSVPTKTSVNVEVCSQDTSGSRIISFEGTAVMFIVLKKRSFVHLNGACKLQVLYGCVEAFGYQFEAGEKVYDIFSLTAWPQISLKVNSRPFEETPDVVRDMLAEHHLTSNIFVEIVEDLNKDSAVVCLFPLREPYLDYVHKKIPIIMPPLDSRFNLIYSATPNVYQLKINKHWADLVKWKSNNLKVLVCGGKRVGKSTLLTYLINRCLTFHEKVCVINLDPKQADFTMSACISIVVIDTPVFGPAFTRQAKPINSISVNVDVTRFPSRYLSAVIELYSLYTSMDTLPTLINTIGYVPEHGSNIISQVIASVNPNTVIEIRSPHVPNNFPKRLSCRTVRNELPSIIEANLNYTHIAVPMNFKEADVNKKFTPTRYFCRELSTMIYFAKIVDSRSLSLKTGVIPMYKVSVDSITVLDETYTVVEPRKIRNILKANVVALCSNLTAPYNDDLYHCHGYGIVRCIVDNAIMLLTPIERLEMVTHFIVGVVPLPKHLLFEDKNSKKLSPHLAKRSTRRTRSKTIDWSNYFKRKYLY